MVDTFTPSWLNLETKNNLSNIYIKKNYKSRKIYNKNIKSKKRFKPQIDYELNLINYIYKFVEVNYINRKEYIVPYETDEEDDEYIDDSNEFIDDYTYLNKY